MSFWEWLLVIFAIIFVFCAYYFGKLKNQMITWGNIPYFSLRTGGSCWITTDPPRQDKRDGHMVVKRQKSVFSKDDLHVPGTVRYVPNDKSPVFAYGPLEFEEGELYVNQVELMREARKLRTDNAELRKENMILKSQNESSILDGARQIVNLHQQKERNK